MLYKKYQRFNQFKACLTYNDGSVKTVIGEQSEVDQFERDVAPQCQEVLEANYQSASHILPLPLPSTFMTDEDRQALGVEPEVQLSAGELATHGGALPLPSTMPDMASQVARHSANANQRPQRAAQPQTGETPLPTPQAAWDRAFKE